MNGHLGVSEATRARVQGAIAALDYRPSQLARDLSRGRSGTVAVVVPFITRPSVVARLRGAIDVLTAHGLEAVVHNVETPAQRDHQLSLLGQRRRADGVIVVSLPLPGETLATLARPGAPVVLVDCSSAGFVSAVVDDVRGGRCATAHLLALGHRRIGFVGDQPDPGFGFHSSADREAGWRRELSSSGVVADERLCARSAHSAGEAARCAEHLLGQEAPPSAIFAASDTQALGVLQAAETLGIAVPEELSVVGFDDIDAASLRGLTTVRQPLEASGAWAAEQILASLGYGRCAGEQAPEAPEQTGIVFPIELVERGTTAPPGGCQRPGAGSRRAPSRWPSGEEGRPTGNGADRGDGHERVKAGPRAREAGDGRTAELRTARRDGQTECEIVGARARGVTAGHEPEHMGER